MQVKRRKEREAGKKLVAQRHHKVRGSPGLHVMHKAIFFQLHCSTFHTKAADLIGDDVLENVVEKFFLSEYPFILLPDLSEALT